jgi:ribosome maturation factor RimP
MEKVLAEFKGKLVKIFTTSGGESYVGKLTEVGEDYITVKDQNKGDDNYISIRSIEALKPLREDHPGE